MWGMGGAGDRQGCGGQAGEAVWGIGGGGGGVGADWGTGWIGQGPTEKEGSIEGLGEEKH